MDISYPTDSRLDQWLERFIELADAGHDLVPLWGRIQNDAAEARRLAKREKAEKAGAFPDAAEEQWRLSPVRSNWRKAYREMEPEAFRAELDRHLTLGGWIGLSVGGAKPRVIEDPERLPLGTANYKTPDNLPPDRPALAARLDALEIRWAGARAGAKAPGTTRPNELPPASWDEHFEGGFMEAGRQAWIAGKLDAIYIWPASVPLGACGSLLVDNDREAHHAADMADLYRALPTPVLHYPRPDGAAKSHTWFASDAPVTNGHYWLGGRSKRGDLRGLAMDGTLGIGVRMYPGELEALLDAVEAALDSPPPAVQDAHIEALREHEGRGQAEFATEENGPRTIEWAVERIDAIEPGEGLHHNPAFCGSVLALVLAGRLTDAGYDEQAEPLLEAMRRAEARGVNTSRRAAGFEHKELRDAFNTAKARAAEGTNFFWSCVWWLWPRASL